VSGKAEQKARLDALAGRHFGEGARVVAIDPALGGGSNQTTFFEVLETGTATPLRLVLRQETYRAPKSPFIRPDWQYALVRAAYLAEVPVPRPYFLLEERDGLGRGFVMERVDGEALPRRILRDPAFEAVRPRLAGQCGEILAAIHDIDTDALEFLPEIPESRDPIDAQRQRLDFYDEAHPALELGFRWLEEKRPAPERRTLVHGDFRNGNFIIGHAGIRAVLDWECSHTGDPLEDLGWLCTRSWRFGSEELPVGGFGRRADLYRGYQAAGGNVDPERIRYWEVYGLVRWAVINLMQAHGHVFEARSSVVFAACGRNVAEIEYDLLKTLDGTLV
jgi:aminoglycoside phosphotransferase (APT) family kinase protein